MSVTSSPTSDIDMSLVPKTVTGNLRCAQSLARRLSCPRGSIAFTNCYLDLVSGALVTEVIGDPNYGIDITDRVQDTITAADVKALQAAIQAECLKAEFVDRCSVTVTYDQPSGALAIAIQAFGSEGLVSFTLAATNEGLTIQ